MYDFEKGEPIFVLYKEYDSDNDCISDLWKSAIITNVDNNIIAAKFVDTDDYIALPISMYNKSWSRWVG